MEPTQLDPTQLQAILDAFATLQLHVDYLRTVLLWVFGLQLFRIFGDLFRPWDRKY